MSLPEDAEKRLEYLVLSTEDGRVIFYSTQELQEVDDDAESTIPFATPIAQVGGRQAGFPGRIKDFEILSLEEQPKEFGDGVLIVTGNSEGTVRIWKVGSHDLALVKQSKGSEESKHPSRQVGQLVTTYETGNRITCLAAFIMLPAEDLSALSDIESEDVGEEEESSSEESDDE